MPKRLQEYYVYIMTNKGNTALYAGHANDLSKRVWEHKVKYYPKSFTTRYKINKLVYYEVCYDPVSMITREKQIKNLVRRKKIALIEKDNPKWEDLAKDW